MPSEVVPIRPGLRPKGDRTPVPEVIEELERLLEEARAGDIIAFAYVTLTPEFAVSYRGEGVGDRLRLIGGLTALTHRYLVDEYDADPDDGSDGPDDPDDGVRNRAR